MSEEKTEEETSEVITIAATEKYKGALASLMDDEKKEKLLAKLNSLKLTLDRVEERMESNLSEEVSASEVKVFSPGEAIHLIDLMCRINNDVRQNMRLIDEVGPRESKDNMLKKGLEIIDKTGSIYEEILDYIS